MSASTQACVTGDGSVDPRNLLSVFPGANRDLSCGEYDFAGANWHFGSSFVDRWAFTVAEDSIATISVTDIELGLNFPTDGSKWSEDGAAAKLDSLKIFDTRNLTFSLFDEDGSLLGSAVEGESLTNLSLAAGDWYLLRISGTTAGLFGSAYYGVLDTTCVTEVPLGGAGPLLGSALALLVLGRDRRRGGAPA